jgi:hypothetical protein
LIRKLDGKTLIAENHGLHLLSYDAEGHLGFDDDSFAVQPDYTGATAAATNQGPDAANPQDQDSFIVKLSPGDHLCLAGCTAKSGLSPVADQPGAFAVEFKKSPAARCALGEDTSFTVSVVAKGF